MIHQSLDNLDKDIQSLAFEAQVRKQMMSNTISGILQYQTNQTLESARLPKVNAVEPLMEDGAIREKGGAGA
jgi:hypothetical protein